MLKKKNVINMFFYSIFQRIRTKKQKPFHIVSFVFYKLPCSNLSSTLQQSATAAAEIIDDRCVIALCKDDTFCINLHEVDPCGGGCLRASGLSWLRVPHDQQRHEEAGQKREKETEQGKQRVRKRRP